MAKQSAGAQGPCIGRVRQAGPAGHKPAPARSIHGLITRPGSPGSLSHRGRGCGRPCRPHCLARSTRRSFQGQRVAAMDAWPPAPGKAPAPPPDAGPDAEEAPPPPPPPTQVRASPSRPPLQLCHNHSPAQPLDSLPACPRRVLRTQVLVERPPGMLALMEATTDAVAVQWAPVACTVVAPDPGAAPPPPLELAVHYELQMQQVGRRVDEGGAAFGLPAGRGTPCTTQRPVQRRSTRRAWQPAAPTPPAWHCSATAPRTPLPPLRARRWTARRGCTPNAGACSTPAPPRSSTCAACGRGAATRHA